MSVGIGKIYGAMEGKQRKAQRRLYEFGVIKDDKLMSISYRALNMTLEQADHFSKRKKIERTQEYILDQLPPTALHKKYNLNYALASFID